MTWTLFAIYLLGIVSAYALLLAALVVLFKRGGWELERYEREDQF